MHGRECIPGECSCCGTGSTETECRLCPNLPLKVLTLREPLLERRTSTIPGAGQGAFLLHDVSKGEYIAGTPSLFGNSSHLTGSEYTGILQEKWLSEILNLSYHKFDKTCLFYLDEQFDLEAISAGGIAKFANMAVNQSPNCATVSILDGAGTRHVVLYATRNLRSGTEILYDYRINGRSTPSLKAAGLAGRRSEEGEAIPPDQAASALPTLFPRRVRLSGSRS